MRSEKIGVEWIVGLDHVQLAMPAGEEESAREFFVDLLGLEEVVKPGPLKGRGGCWFRGGNIEVHLGIQENFVAAKKAHPAFLCPDLDGLASRLEEAGYGVRHDGSLPTRRRFFVNDPFGNRLEFLRDGDGFSQRPG